MSRIEKRLLILWFALAFVVWNGVYDMRMHDTMRGYLLEAALAQAGLGRGVDMRTVAPSRPRRRRRILDRLGARRLPGGSDHDVDLSPLHRRTSAGLAPLAPLAPAPLAPLAPLARLAPHR